MEDVVHRERDDDVVRALEERLDLAERVGQPAPSGVTAWKLDSQGAGTGGFYRLRDRNGAPVDRIVALPVKDLHHIARNLIQLLELFAPRAVEPRAERSGEAPAGNREGGGIHDRWKHLG